MTGATLTQAAAVAGLTATLGDIVIPALLARWYPGYESTREPLSRLGCSDSPVRLWINVWWCLFGVLISFFAWGFFRAFGNGVLLSWPALAALLLFLFGLGSGPGAGLFPMDIPGTPATRSGSLHNSLSGAGFIALVFFPAVCVAVFGGGKSAAIFWLSVATFAGGLACGALISISGKPSAQGVLALGGLWQRAFLVNYYLHLIAIAVLMLRSDDVVVG